MPLENERLEILKMVQSKQISPEDGARLLKAITSGSAQPPARPTPPAAPGNRWFKLAVEEPGRERVNLTVPLQTVPTILRFVSRWVPDEHRDALQAVSDAIETGYRGDILQVERPGGERVRLWIE
jgi:hypothetical protein